MKILSILLLTFTIALSACQPAPANLPEPENPDSTVTSPSLPPDTSVGSWREESPYAVQPGDEKLQGGNIYINSSELLTLESYPPQFVLSVSGDLPDPCHQLRVKVTEADSENRIYVSVYTLVNPDAICIQVLKPFDINIPLGSFPTGEYQLYLNGEKVADFQS
ncbi:MAG: hypothetical protein CVU44_11875 [Chloroflexi bacterium HGW-Chloroflexi-6]|nr:MAG: hypothetical protein CVU44_11875 [Chloroflexi bacterium HGW-Chloroflexi-6]